MLPAITRDVTIRSELHGTRARLLASDAASNPLDPLPAGTPSPSRPVAAREAYHELNAAMQPLLEQIQYPEDLSRVLQAIEGLR